MSLVAKMTRTPADPPREDTCEGMDRDGAKLEEQLRPHIITRVYADGVKGVGTDAILLMHKVNGTAGHGWSDWGDYDVLVPRLVEILREKGKRLTVDVWYAEKDWMIGDGGESKGAKWFDQCWDEEKCGDVVEYRRAVVKGADHDGIWNLRWGCVQTVFERAGQPVV
jgi:hypothetical protein